MNRTNTGRVERHDAPRGTSANRIDTNARTAPRSPQIEREAARLIADARAKLDAARLDAGRAMYHDLASAGRTDGGDLSPSAELNARSMRAFEERNASRGSR